MLSPPVIFHSLGFCNDNCILIVTVNGYWGLYLEVDKVLKCILLLDIYINMAISRIIVSEIIEVDDIININRDNIDSVYID